MRRALLAAFALLVLFHCETSTDSNCRCARDDSEAGDDVDAWFSAGGVTPELH